MSVGIEFAKTRTDGPFPIGTGTLHLNDDPIASIANAGPTRVLLAFQ